MYSLCFSSNCECPRRWKQYLYLQLAPSVLKPVFLHVSSDPSRTPVVWKSPQEGGQRGRLHVLPFYPTSLTAHAVVGYIRFQCLQVRWTDSADGREQGLELVVLVAAGRCDHNERIDYSHPQARKSVEAQVAHVLAVRAGVPGLAIDRHHMRDDGNDLRQFLVGWVVFVAGEVAICYLAQTRFPGQTRFVVVAGM